MCLDLSKLRIYTSARKLPFQSDDVITDSESKPILLSLTCVNFKIIGKDSFFPLNKPIPLRDVDQFRLLYNRTFRCS
jgi:hypothetical protein